MTVDMTPYVTAGDHSAHNIENVTIGQPIKALSLWQPWATLIAAGYKRIETRSWPTSYRGPIAIHAAKTWNSELEQLCWTQPFAKALFAYTELPRGCIVAVANLRGCRQATPRSYAFAQEQTELADDAGMPSEFHFGDFTPGRWLWMLDDVRAIDPIPASGKQGLWEWTVPADERLSGITMPLPLDEEAS